MIELFDIDTNGKVKPTKHCHTIKWLKVFMDKDDYHPDVYPYIFYMSFYGRKNPFFNIKEGMVQRSEIIEAIQPKFSLDDADLEVAIDKAKILYNTPLSRMHQAIKIMIDNIADHIAENKVTTGRDGNLQTFIRLGKEFESIRKSYKAISADFEEEQTMGRARGGADLGYDQQ